MKIVVACDDMVCSHEMVLTSLLVVLHKALSNLPQFLSQYLDPLILAVCNTQLWSLVIIIIIIIPDSNGLQLLLTSL